MISLIAILSGLQSLLLIAIVFIYENKIKKMNEDFRNAQPIENESNGWAGSNTNSTSYNPEWHKAQVDFE
jgi:hypothetical protein